MEPPSLTQEQRVPHLVALTGPSVGTAYRLTKPEMIVGREGADICLEQKGVSRRHARLLVTGEKVVVEDLGSTNGTFVGVDRVKRPTVVKDGENVAFGTFAQFRFTHVEPSGGLGRAPEPSGAQDSSVKVGTREYLLDLLGAEYAYARWKRRVSERGPVTRTLHLGQ
jgi:two-component system, cell cycle response regulator